MAYPAPAPHTSRPPSRHSLLLKDLKGLFVKPEVKGIGFTYDPSLSSSVSSSSTASSRSSGKTDKLDSTNVFCFPRMSFDIRPPTSTGTLRVAALDAKDPLPNHPPPKSKTAEVDFDDSDVVIIGWQAVLPPTPPPTEADLERRWLEAWFRDKLRSDERFLEGARRVLYV